MVQYKIHYWRINTKNRGFFSLLFFWIWIFLKPHYTILGCIIWSRKEQNIVMLPNNHHFNVIFCQVHVWDFNRVQGKILQSLGEVMTLIFKLIMGLPGSAQVKTEHHHDHQQQDNCIIASSVCHQRLTIWFLNWRNCA